MVDRNNFDRLRLKAIHETVVPVEDLAEGFVANLRDDTTGCGAGDTMTHEEGSRTPFVATFISASHARFACSRSSFFSAFEVSRISPHP
jgi:hypothetical protein